MLRLLLVAGGGQGLSHQARPPFPRQTPVCILEETEAHRGAGLTPSPPHVRGGPGQQQPRPQGTSSWTGLAVTPRGPGAGFRPCCRWCPPHPPCPPVPAMRCLWAVCGWSVCGLSVGCLWPACGPSSVGPADQRPHLRRWCTTSSPSSALTCSGASSWLLRGMAGEVGPAGAEGARGAVWVSSPGGSLLPPFFPLPPGCLPSRSRTHWPRVECPKVCPGQPRPLVGLGALSPQRGVR